MNVLIIVDMQNDFVDGALGTPEAVAIVPKVVEKIRNFDGLFAVTKDTHEENYLETQEGKKLTVPAGETIAMPFKIGCGLGGGDWNVIFGLIQKELSDKYIVELWRKEV